MSDLNYTHCLHVLSFSCITINVYCPGCLPRGDEGALGMQHVIYGALSWESIASFYKECYVFKAL